MEDSPNPSGTQLPANLQFPRRTMWSQETHGKTSYESFPDTVIYSAKPPQQDRFPPTEVSTQKHSIPYERDAIGN